MQWSSTVFCRIFAVRSDKDWRNFHEEGVSHWGLCKVTTIITCSPPTGQYTSAITWSGVRFLPVSYWKPYLSENWTSPPTHTHTHTHAHTHTRTYTRKLDCQCLCLLEPHGQLQPSKGFLVQQVSKVSELTLNCVTQIGTYSWHS